MESLIPLVKIGTRINVWKNGKDALFKYDEINVSYQVFEIKIDSYGNIIPLTKDGHIVASGFVAYLIHNLGKSEEEIYKGYYELRLSDFIKKEEKLPGAIRRDLKSEYYDQHIKEENEKVADSQKIYPYLTDNDSKLINQYVLSYFEYIVKYNKQKQIQELNKQTDHTPPPPPDTDIPETFENLFYSENGSEIFLNILKHLEPPYISIDNNYIGKSKGIFPMIINIFKTKSLIKNYSDKVYKDLLNNKINGLHLSKDASEFRTNYSMLEKKKVDVEIKAILSQYSQTPQM